MTRVQPLTPTQPSLVALRGRISEPEPYSLGVEPLARALGEQLGTPARMIANADPAPRSGDWAADLARSRGLLLEAGGQLEDALGAGRRPVLVAGDCALALGTLPALGRLRPDAHVLWLDAHGDFNTPASSPSAWLGGMGLAGACGAWETGLPGEPFAARRLALCGTRSLDEGERDRLVGSGATVIGPSLETLVALAHALDGAPVFVHLDPDVLDPEYMGAEYPAPGGLTPERLYDLLDAVGDSCEVLGVEVCSWYAPQDAGALADAIATIAGVMAPLLPTKESEDER